MLAHLTTSAMSLTNLEAVQNILNKLLVLRMLLDCNPPPDVSRVLLAETSWSASSTSCLDRALDLDFAEGAAFALGARFAAALGDRFAAALGALFAAALGARFAAALLSELCSSLGEAAAWAWSSWDSFVFLLRLFFAGGGELPCS